MVFTEELKRMPMLRLLIPFILGIIIQYYFQVSSLTLLPACAAFFILVLIFGISEKLNRHYPRQWVYGFVLSGFMLLMAMTIMKRSMQSASFLDNTGEDGFIIVVALEFPQERENSTRLIVRPESLIVRDTVFCISGKAIVWFAKDSQAAGLRPGDRLIVANNFREIRNRGNPYEFDYKEYLRIQGIHGESFVSDKSWRLIDSGRTGSLVYYPETIRKHLLDKLTRFNITGREHAVAGALLLGFRGGLDQDMRNSYAASGAMHILAVSGLHVGILYVLLIWILGLFKRYRFFLPARLIIVLLVLWAYALITGLSPSVTRSATMFSFLILARSSRRNTNIYNTLAASAIIQLIADPFALFLAGFQLSYLAVAGIAFYQPHFYSLNRLKNCFARKIWALITVSFSAQLLIFPLIIFYFNQFPSYFLFTNLLAIPLATIILYSGLTFFVISGVPVLSSGIAFLLDYALLALNLITETISKIPYSQFSGIVISFPVMAILYGAVLSGTAYAIRKKPFFLMITMALIFTGLLLRAESKIKHAGQQFFIIYNSGSFSLYNFISGHDNIIITGMEEDIGSVEVPYAASGIALKLKADRLEVLSVDEFNELKSVCESYPVKKSDGFVSFNGYRIYFAINGEFNYTGKLSPVHVDMVVISSGSSGPEEIFSIVSPQIVVFDSTVPFFKKMEMINHFNERGMRYHDVRISGAYTVNIR
jgi:competence protein ComEC